MILTPRKWLASRVKAAIKDAAQDASQELFGLSYWYEPNLWEPPVQIALRDLCRPGAVVFDVGANFGGLTTVMSRMVGPRGAVCAFEASPRIVDKCQRNLVLNGCANTQLYHAAVYHTSFERVPIYLGGHLNDSIYDDSQNAQPAYQVSTIALDDFVRHTGLSPDAVKMDIEGAEFDALQGMARTIETNRPHMVLETQPGDSRCLDFLRERGYVALDLNTYREVRGPDDYPAGVTIRNNLYLHSERIAETPYRLPFEFNDVATVEPGAFRAADDGSLELREPVSLSRGRYLIDVDFRADGADNNMMCGVRTNGVDIFRYHAYTRLLAESYRDWIIELPAESAVTLYFEFHDGTSDSTFEFERARIVRIQGFEDAANRLF